MKQKASYLRYIILFVIILIVNFMFSDLHASQNDNSMNPSFVYHYEIPCSQQEIAIHQQYLEKINCLTETQRAFYEKKLKQHEFDAQRTYNNAKSKCFLLPYKSYREFSQKAFGAAIIFAGTPGNVMSRAIATLIYA